MHTSKFAKKVHLDSLKLYVDKLYINKLKTISSALNDLKSKVDELNVDKLENVPVDFKRLSNVADKHIVRKSV